MQGEEPVAVDELAAVEQAIAALDAQRALLGDPVVETALAPLLDKRDRLLAATVGEQRKLVTVLFADLVDFTAVSQRLDAEDVRRVVNGYFAGWRSAIEGEGGVVEKFIGDAVMAVFGVYRAREDDAHRAVRAALAMREAMESLNAELGREHGVALRMRVGIDTGEVVVSTLGERSGEEFVVVGDTVNRSARLQAAAPEDGILISPDTCRHVRGSFRLQHVEALRLKGIAEPVDGYLVVSGATQGFWPEARGVEGVTTATVGRDLELGALQKAYADMVEDRSRRVVTVVGEAGVGKSRLVHDFEDWLAGHPDEVWALRGRASPYTEDVPNALLRSVFAERLRIADTDAPTVVRQRWHEGIAAFLGGGDQGAAAADAVATWLGFSIGTGPDVEGLRTDPEALRRRASRLVLDLLAALAERAPIVVLLEDLHWADSASLDWLEEVAAASPGHPLLVLATTRPTLLERRPHWGEDPQAHTALRLEPLSRRESRALLTEILQRVPEVPPALADLVVDAAEGNPFYIEELVKWLIEEAVIVPGDGAWTVAEEAVRTVRVPSTLRGVLQARLDSLDPTERNVVERASVVGRVFWDRAVTRLAGPAAPAAPEDALDRLRSRELVFQRPRSSFERTREFSFRHALMRDVAYEGVLRTERRRYHLLAARWLEEVVEQSQRPDEHSAAVAHHYEAAGKAGPAARWYLRAGRAAAATFAGDDALRLLARADALAPAPDVALRCDVLLAREGVLDRVGRRPAQRATLDELAAMTGLDATRRSQVRLAEGRWLFFHGRYAEASAVADEAAGLARDEGRGDLELDALLLGGRSLAFASDHDGARRLLDRALQRARELEDHRGAGESLRLLGVVATNLGENDTVLELLAAARHEYRAGKDVEGEALVAGQIGASLINMERLEEARAASEEALAMFVATGHRLRQGIVLGNLSTVAIEQGRLDDAWAHALETLRITEDLDDPEGIVSSLSRLGEVARLTGDYRSARTYLDRGVAFGTDRGTHYFTAHVLCSLVAVDVAEGRLDEGLHHAERARHVAELADIPHAQARALLAAGLVTRAAGRRDAVGLLAEAAELFGRLGMRADRAESRSAWALAVLAEGDEDAAGRAAEELLADLDDGVVPGALHPGQVLVDCHAVLRATGSPRAVEIPPRAARFLADRSAAIHDAGMRAGFLSTPVNVALASLAAGVGR